MCSSALLLMGMPGRARAQQRCPWCQSLPCCSPCRHPGALGWAGVVGDWEGWWWNITHVWGTSLTEFLSFLPLPCPLWALCSSVWCVPDVRTAGWVLPPGLTLVTSLHSSWLSVQTFSDVSINPGPNFSSLHTGKKPPKHLSSNKLPSHLDTSLTQFFPQ